MDCKREGGNFSKKVTEIVKRVFTVKGKNGTKGIQKRKRETTDSRRF